MTTVCCIQPSYIPWKGFFHLIQKSDVFIFLDTVQYDKRGWRNRNQIKFPQGPKWLSIPVEAKGSHQGLRIQDVKIHDGTWVEQHLQSIRTQYRKAPFFEQEFPWIERTFQDLAGQYELLSQLTSELTIAIARRIGIEKTEFLYASDLPVEETEPSLRLLKLIQAVNGTCYLSGPSAKGYLDEALFNEHGIEVAWMEYDYPEYPQLHPPFTHHVSILDMMLMIGSQFAGQYVWSHKSLTACGEHFSES